MMRLVDASQLFLDLGENNAQMDIFRENGQILLQVYRYSDVKRWDCDIDFGIRDGYVFELLFSKSKTDNAANFARFQNTEARTSFHKFNKIEQNSFFAFLPKNVRLEKFEKFISSTLSAVYGNLENIDFQVNVY